MGAKVLREGVSGGQGKKEQTTKKKCDCKGKTTPEAVFVDDDADEAYLLMVCEMCGSNYLLMGLYPLVIC